MADARLDALALRQRGIVRVNARAELILSRVLWHAVGGRLPNTWRCLLDGNQVDCGVLSPCAGRMMVLGAVVGFERRRQVARDRNVTHGPGCE
jgi:hypothetical protein